MKEKLLYIIKHHGIRKQLKKLSEELYEFQESVIDNEYGFTDAYRRKKKLKEHMEEEFADMMVLMEQFKAFYGLENDKIIEIMKFKIERTIKEIEKKKESIAKRNKK